MHGSVTMFFCDWQYWWTFQNVKNYLKFGGIVVIWEVLVLWGSELKVACLIVN